MLKGKLADMLETYHYETISQQDLLNLNTKIINLFKSEVDKLTVIDEEKMVKAINDGWKDEATDIDTLEPGDYELCKAQLQHDKQTLLDLMGE